MAPRKPFKPLNKFKFCCLFGHYSKVICNAIESNNQGVIKGFKG